MSLQIICECSRRVASHCHRCIRNWPPSRLFSGRVDYMQPILAANNVAFVAMRLRAVPRELRLLGFQEDFSGVHFTSPSPRALSPRAHSPCHPQRRSYGDIQAAAVITMVTAATPAADQPSDPLSKSMPSPRRSLELPDVVPPAVKQFRNEGKSSDSGGGGSVQRSRSFKERKSPMSSLGVSSSPVVVRRTGSLRRSRKKGDRNSGDAGARGEENGSGLRRSHRPLSCSSPDLLLFVNGRPGDSGSAASDETVGTQRQRAATRLVIDNCMRDLSTVLMQIGQQVVTKVSFTGMSVHWGLGALVCLMPDPPLGRFFRRFWDGFWNPQGRHENGLVWTVLSHTFPTNLCVRVCIGPIQSADFMSESVS